MHVPLTNAQTTINTTVGSTNYLGNNNSGAGSFITFLLENNTTGGILITDVGNWTTTAHNGTTSTLYFSATSLSGPITGNALPAAGWTQVASGTVAGVTTTGVNPVITGMSVLMPAGAIWRFALNTTGTNYYSLLGAAIPTPNSFTQNGVTLRTGDYQIAGQNVGYGFTNNPRYFTGFVTFMPAIPCSGQPVAGSAVANLGCPANISLAGSTAGGATGITVQWQKRDKCSTIWSNIPGANGLTLPISTPPNSTDYRAYLICTNSTLADTSTLVNVSSISPCYCSPSITTATNDDIFTFTVGSFTNASVCASLATGPGTIINQYSNYTTLPPIKLPKNSTNSFSLQSGNCGSTNLTYGVAVFIDLNRNGTFDAGENVFATPNAITSPVNVSGTIAIPASATTGVTGMRVVLASGTPGTSITGCGTYTDGEIEDYLVDIQYTPEVTGGGVHCSGEDVTLTMSAPGLPNPQLLWKLPDGSFSTSTTINLNNIQTNQSGTYTAYMLINNCPGMPPDTSGARTVSVIVNQSPSKPIIAPVITYCLGDDFDSIPVFGQNLKWYSVPTGGIPLLQSPLVNTNQPGSATYYVSQTKNSCESPRAAVTINVVPKPDPPIVETPVTYCQGRTAQPLSALGQNIRWYSVPAGGVGSTFTPTPNTNAQGTFTWYASQTVGGCESDRVPVVVKVSYIPNAVILTSKPYVCQYDTITLSYFGNAASDAQFIWTLPEGATIVDGIGRGPLAIRFDSAGLMTVRLTVDNAGCVGPEATVDIPVRLSPRFTLSLQEEACKGDIVNLAVDYSTTGIDKYEWFGFAGGEEVYGSPTKGPFGIKWNSPGVKIIEVLATDEDCRSLPFTDTITIHDLPDARIDISNNNICSGDTIEFEAPFEAGSSYLWEPAQFFGASHSYRDSGVIDYETYVRLSVTNRFNCRATDSVLINAKPCCDVYFPNAFTPNNDGRNDLFRPITTGTHEVTAFRVQNRWGQTVFTTGNEQQGWDGSFNGKPQDIGTYFFFMKYKCSNGEYYEEKGEVMLVR